MARDWTGESRSLTQGLVAVLRVAGQPEQRGPHLLTPLVQILKGRRVSGERTRTLLDLQLVFKVPTLTSSWLLGELLSLLKPCSSWLSRLTLSFTSWMALSRLETFSTRFWS